MSHTATAPSACRPLTRAAPTGVHVATAYRWAAAGCARNGHAGINDPRSAPAVADVEAEGRGHGPTHEKREQNAY